LAGFKNILVASNPGQLSASIMHQAVDLADRHDAQLALLGFVEPLRPWQREINVAGKIVDVERLLTESHTEVLSSMAKRAGGTDVAVDVKTGKPSQEVSRFVMAKDIDLVIVGEPAPEPGRDQGLSPGVMQLLRTCPAPVWVMRPSRTRKLRVLALVDPDPTDRTRDELNQKILELAMSLAADGSGELHVGHAWEMPGESFLRASAFVSLSDEEVDLMVGATEQEHRQRLDELVARHGVAAAGGRTHMVHGDPSKALPALCELTRCNLVVLGTVARTGLSGLIMGNTAETILRSVSSSVLALKPDGFETPVRMTDGRFRSRP
jgi:nucleotide-binding universal stress UspA family protein